MSDFQTSIRRRVPLTQALDPRIMSLPISWSRIFLIATVIFGLLAAAFFATNSEMNPEPAVASPLIHGFDRALLSPTQASNARQAREDFERVRSGQTPRCKSKPNLMISDGGTTIYNCPHYQITVGKSLSVQNGVSGYMFGPTIVFSQDYSVSDVRFYSDEQMTRLLQGADPL